MYMFLSKKKGCRLTVLPVRSFAGQVVEGFKISWRLVWNLNNAST
jgi:hypothetical protein